MFNVKKLAFGAALLAASAVCFAAPKVEIVTSEGNIVVNLNEKAAPTTVANFVKYANEGFYNGTIFHRVINEFFPGHFPCRQFNAVPGRPAPVRPAAGPARRASLTWSPTAV